MLLSFIKSNTVKEIEFLSGAGVQPAAQCNAGQTQASIVKAPSNEAKIDGSPLPMDTPSRKSVATKGKQSQGLATTSTLERSAVDKSIVRTQTKAKEREQLQEAADAGGSTEWRPRPMEPGEAVQAPSPRRLETIGESLNEEPWEPIKNFSWDQGSRKSPWVDVIVDVAGVNRDNVRCSFRPDAFDLKIRLVKRKLRLFQTSLDHDIVPDECRLIVKTGRVVVKLRKEPCPGKKDGGNVYETWFRLAKSGGVKERQEARAPRHEGSEHYDVVRQLYEQGNDHIRRQIGEAYERNKSRVLTYGPEGPLADILSKEQLDKLNCH